MRKHENSAPSDLSSHQGAWERPVNVCDWELALGQIPGEEVGREKVFVHISVSEEEKGQSNCFLPEQSYRRGDTEILMLCISLAFMNYFVVNLSQCCIACM